jgi:peptide/nickel transport system permease protein
VAYCLLSLFLLSVTIFFFVRVTGDPATLLVEPGASEADIAAMHHQFGLDRPLWVQYGLFMASLAHGDLGKSFYYRTPVMELYLSRLPNSLHLAAVAMLCENARSTAGAVQTRQAPEDQARLAQASKGHA